MLSVLGKPAECQILECRIASLTTSDLTDGCRNKSRCDRWRSSPYVPYLMPLVEF